MPGSAFKALASGFRGSGLNEGIVLVGGGGGGENNIILHARSSRLILAGELVGLELFRA